LGDTFKPQQQYSKAEGEDLGKKKISEHYLFIYLFFVCGTGIELRALHLLGKHFTTEAS
jgi:hypothetical protein